MTNLETTMELTLGRENLKFMRERCDDLAQQLSNLIINIDAQEQRNRALELILEQTDRRTMPKTGVDLDGAGEPVNPNAGIVPTYPNGRYTV